MPFAIQHPISCRGAVLAGSVLASIVAAACGGGGSSNPGNANAYITNANNYTSVSSLTIPPTPTAAGADLHICWTSLTTDLLGHPLVPATDIDHVTFLQVVGLTKAEIAKQFAAGTFATTSVKKYLDYIVDHSTGSTCAQLSAFSLGGVTLVPADDYKVDSSKIYMLLFAKGKTPGVGSKSMMFLEPSASSINLEVAAPDGKTILSFEADLKTPKPVDIPAAGPYVIDWSQLTIDGMGNPVVYEKIDSLLVGYYEGMTVDQLQEQCLNFDIIATSLYRVDIPIGPKSADLATTKTAAGVPFAGFTPNNGVWAVGLMCSSCQVPAPIAVAILNPQ